MSDFCWLLLGLPRLRKPTQAEVCDQVFEFVRQLVPSFKLTDIKWVRVLRSVGLAAYNTECVNVASATLVKSAFAEAVKSEKAPSFIGKVSKVR